VPLNSFVRQIPATKRRREAFVVLTVAGAALMLAAAPSHYTYKANDVAILWLVVLKFFLIAGVIVKEVVFRRVGLLTGLLVGLHLAETGLPLSSSPFSRVK